MYTPSNFISMQSLNDLALAVSEKKKATLKVFQTRKYDCKLPPLNLCTNQK